MRTGTGVPGITAGRCMWPFLAAGQRVLPSQEEPKVGSVVIYRNGEDLFAHRVVGMFDGGVFVRPDRPGARIDRVPGIEIEGVWANASGLRGFFLRPSVGALIARAGLALSGPSSLELLGRLRGIVSRRPIGPVAVGVFQGDAAELARVLTVVGLGPEDRSLEALETAYLRPQEGFVVTAAAHCPLGAPRGLVRPPLHGPRIHGSSDDLATAEVAKCGPAGRHVGAIAVRLDEQARPAVRGLATIAVRAGLRSSEAADRLLLSAVDEASARGFEIMETQSAPTDEAVVGALLRHGFRIVDPAHRCVPSVAARKALFSKPLRPR